MELKDVILSTIAEMDTTTTEEVSSSDNNPFDVHEKKEVPTTTTSTVAPTSHTLASYSSSEGELKFLENVRERLLVLFEGFQSPNNTNIEAKVDLTLNFLEYLLATIDTRVETIEREN